MNDTKNMQPPENIPASAWASEATRSSSNATLSIFRSDGFPMGTTRCRMVASKVLVPSTDGKYKTAYFPEEVKHMTEGPGGDWIVARCPRRCGGMYCKVCAAWDRLPEDHAMKDRDNFKASPTKRNNVGVFYIYDEGALRVKSFPDSVRKAIAQIGRTAATMRTPINICSLTNGYDLDITKSEKGTGSKKKIDYSVVMVPELCALLTDETGKPRLRDIERIATMVPDLNPLGEVTERDFQNIDGIINALRALSDVLNDQELAWSYNPEDPLSTPDDAPDYEEDAPEEIPASVAALATAPPVVARPPQRPAPPPVAPPQRPAAPPSARPAAPAAPLPLPRVAAPPATAGIQRPAAGGIQRPPPTQATSVPRTAVEAMNNTRAAAAVDPMSGPPDGDDDQIPF